MGKIFHNETTVDGIKFDSETEAKYYMYIRDNKEKLNIKEIELQPEFILQQKYILTPDGKRIDYIDDKQQKQIQAEKERLQKEAISKQAALIQALRDDAQMSRERQDYLECLNQQLQKALEDFQREAVQDEQV